MFGQRVENRDLGNSRCTPHQPSMRPSAPGHYASMRTSGLLPDARALNQPFGLFDSSPGPRIENRNSAATADENPHPTIFMKASPDPTALVLNQRLTGR